MVHRNTTQLKFTPGRRGSRIDELETAVCLSRLHAHSGCCSVVYPGRRPKRPSHRRLISLQVDVVGHVLVNGLIDRRRRILADGIQDVSDRLGQSFRTQHGQPLLQRLAADIVEADQFERRRVNPPRKGCLFAPTLRSSKCRARRPLRPVRSLEGTALGSGQTCSRRARPFADRS
jgi:hypothetical protein